MRVTNTNILVLAEKLEQIPGVLQIRFNAPLKSGAVNLIGEGGMIYMAMVPDRDHPGNFVGLRSMVPVTVINDESLHEGVVSSMTNLVNNYIASGTFGSSGFNNAQPIDYIPNSYNYTESKADPAPNNPENNG